MSIQQASGKTLELIKEKINEDEATRDQYLAHIKDWLRKEPHLPNEFDDQRILTFLRSCKYSLEKCKQKLDMYFTVRTVLPQYFTNRDIRRPELQLLIKDMLILILPSITPEGYRLGFMKGPDESVKSVDIASVIKLMYMTADMRLEEECVAGDVYIVDVSLSNPKIFWKLTPSLFKDLVMIALKAYPIRIKAIHIVNIAPWIEKIYDFLRPILPEKLQNRIHFHSNLKRLHAYIPKELLPTEYGGNIGSVYDLHDAWIKKLENYEGWFKEQENIRSNEELRVDRSVKFDEIFGVHGSFRQLSID